MIPLEDNAATSSEKRNAVLAFPILNWPKKLAWCADNSETA
jgi:hypothetical protein